MNYGLYLSASGVLTNMHRQDVIANNLANASTTGFKRDLAAFSQRLPESQENPGPFDLTNDLLDRIGGGLFVAPTQTDFRDGALRQTDNDLDLAIAGDGFLAVRQSEGGQVNTRLTRDGRLSLTSGGQLVTTIGRHPVLSVDGQPIHLDPSASIDIDETGVIRQHDAPVAQLKLASVAEPGRLKHLGAGLYAAPTQAVAETPQAPGHIMQGWLESANVDPVREMVQMIRSARSIDHNAQLLRFHDTMNEQAATVLGRVSG